MPVKSTKSSRRVFLTSAAQVVAGAIVAPTILPSCASGANEKIRLGFIGLGWRGNYSLQFLPKEGFEVVAFSDLNDRRMEEAKAKFNKQASVYKDYKDMLASDNVDAVVISTPDHWHALPAIHACKAGKDVYVEKPLALTIAEGRAMVKAARESKCILQVGIQQRSRKICIQGCQSVLDGTIGKVTEVHGLNYPSPWECDVTGSQEIPEGLDWDSWLGQTSPRDYNYDIYRGSFQPGDNYPDGRPKGWMSYTTWSGGNMTAWGAHGLDTVLWALGKDSAETIEVWPEYTGEESPVTFAGFPLKDNSWKEGPRLTCTVHFKFADGTVIHLDGRGPGFGGLFVGEKGAIMVERETYQLKLAGEEMKTVKEPVVDDDGIVAHMNHWMECIKTRNRSCADVEVAHRSTTLCHLGNIARSLGRKIVWDPNTETFGDDKEANNYIGRKAREPWGLA